jgi:hypothetical protein
VGVLVGCVCVEVGESVGGLWQRLLCSLGCTVVFFCPHGCLPCLPACMHACSHPCKGNYPSPDPSMSARAVPLLQPPLTGPRATVGASWASAGGPRGDTRRRAPPATRPWRCLIAGTSTPLPSHLLHFCCTTVCPAALHSALLLSLLTSLLPRSPPCPALRLRSTS